MLRLDTTLPLLWYHSRLNSAPSSSPVQQRLPIPWQSLYGASTLSWSVASPAFALGCELLCHYPRLQIPLASSTDLLCLSPCTRWEGLCRSVPICWTHSVRCQQLPSSLLWCWCGSTAEPSLLSHSDVWLQQFHPWHSSLNSWSYSKPQTAGGRALYWLQMKSLHPSCSGAAHSHLFWGLDISLPCLSLVSGVKLGWQVSFEFVVGHHPTVCLVLAPMSCLDSVSMSFLALVLVPSPVSTWGMSFALELALVFGFGCCCSGRYSDCRCCCSGSCVHYQCIGPACLDACWTLSAGSCVMFTLVPTAVMLDRVFVEYVITPLWVKADS